MYEAYKFSNIEIEVESKDKAWLIEGHKNVRRGISFMQPHYIIANKGVFYGIATIPIPTTG